MSDWQPMETAPRDGTTILVYGQPEDLPNGMVRFQRKGICTAYWDEIDRSFCLSGATWLGPFIIPTHWRPLPHGPEESGDD